MYKKNQLMHELTESTPSTTYSPEAETTKISTSTEKPPASYMRVSSTDSAITDTNEMNVLLELQLDSRNDPSIIELIRKHIR